MRNRSAVACFVPIRPRFVRGATKFIRRPLTPKRQHPSPVLSNWGTTLCAAAPTRRCASRVTDLCSKGMVCWCWRPQTCTKGQSCRNSFSTPLCGRSRQLDADMVGAPTDISISELACAILIGDLPVAALCGGVWCARGERWRRGRSAVNVKVQVLSNAPHPTPTLRTRNLRPRTRYPA